ncbi:hypothetical protein BGX31_003578, partial [Mortierella sp. GBA43]
MADIKGMAAALTNIDLRNDAILHHISLALDLVVMEAKPSSQAAGMFKDLVKLEKCMTANLESAIAKLPKGHTDKIPDLRSHAILCSGFDINFLEASLVKDHVVIYAVGKVTIPKSVGSSYELAQSLKSILSFKRRVEANADLLLQARSTRPDFPTSEGSSSRFVVVTLFSHGQSYVAPSRTMDSDNLKVLLDDGRSEVQKSDDTHETS